MKSRMLMAETKKWWFLDMGSRLICSRVTSNGRTAGASAEVVEEKGCRQCRSIIRRNCHDDDIPTESCF